MTRKSRQYPASFSAAFYSTPAINGISAEILQENDLDGSSGRSAYTVGTLHFRAETKTEIEGGTDLQAGCITSILFSFCPMFATYE